MCGCVLLRPPCCMLRLQTDVSVFMSAGDVLASLTALQESGRLPELRDDTTVADQLKALAWDTLNVCAAVPACCVQLYCSLVCAAVLQLGMRRQTLLSPCPLPSHHKPIASLYTTNEGLSVRLAVIQLQGAHDQRSAHDQQPLTTRNPCVTLPAAVHPRSCQSRQQDACQPPVSSIVSAAGAVCGGRPSWSWRRDLLRQHGRHTGQGAAAAAQQGADGQVSDLATGTWCLGAPGRWGQPLFGGVSQSQWAGCVVQRRLPPITAGKSVFPALHQAGSAVASELGFLSKRQVTKARPT